MIPLPSTLDSAHQITSALSVKRTSAIAVAVPSTPQMIVAPCNTRSFCGSVASGDRKRSIGWQSTPKNFLFHHGTLIRVYKAKLADQLRACGLYDQVPSAVWEKDFVVDIQAVGHGVPTLKYLAPYVHRVAISDKRITSVNDSSVSYTIRPSKSKATITRTISGGKFVMAFTQHILPKGFQKIRHYGWMSSNSKVKLEEVKWLVWLFLGWRYWLASGHAPQAEPLTAPLRCSECGGTMQVIEVTYESLDMSRGPPGIYIDSG